MELTEMHIMFRQFAQQMGMQNYRALLPEQIDLMLNTSISDITDEIVRTNVGITNDRVVTDNSKISQINALRTLYTVKEIVILEKSSGANSIVPFKFKKAFAYSGRLLSNREFDFPVYRFLVDFSINYINVKESNDNVGMSLAGNNEFDGFDYGAQLNENDANFITNYFPVRIIDDSYLAEAQQDYILQARLRSPIITVYKAGNVDDSLSRCYYDLYVDKFRQQADGSYILDNGLLPYKLRMAYIANPCKVKYNIDQGIRNIDCDLPEELHVNVVKHAVELYNDSIRGSVATEQAKQQRAQQERYRNQNRNEQD